MCTIQREGPGKDMHLRPKNNEREDPGIDEHWRAMIQYKETKQVSTIIHCCIPGQREDPG